MTGRLFGSQAERNPCCASGNDSASLHCVGAIPVGVMACHVAPASVVCDSVTACCVHCVAGVPPNAAQPWASLVNAISGFVKGVGVGRSVQVSPRSVDAKRRAATNAHTTLPDGALNPTTVGSGIGLGELVGVAVGLGTGVDELDGDAAAIGLGLDTA